MSSENREKSLTVEDLLGKLEEVKEIAEKSRVEVESYIKKRPVESAGFFLILGIVVGVLIGRACRRKD